MALKIQRITCILYCKIHLNTFVFCKLSSVHLNYTILALMKKHLFLFALIASISSCSSTGKPLPEINATTLAGKEITNEGLKGKITVIKLWATWCGPCLREIPELNELVDQYKTDTNVVFVAITDDTRATIEKFLSVREFNYQQVTDAKELSGKLHKGLVQYIPEHIVVDQQGNVVFDEIEPPLGIKDTLISVIESLK